MRKRYTKAPLPFTGQKRNFLKLVEKALIENIDNDGEGWTIIDVFGGSGLLARNAKDICPKAQVIFNDYDNYAERLANIKQTNQLRQQLAHCLIDVKPETRLSNEKKKEIIDIIRRFDGYKDIKALTSWLLFSGSDVKSLEALFKKSLWNNLIKRDYPVSDDYLDGLDIVRMDFKDLINQHRHKEKVLFLLDPPYICTEQSTYKKETYFDLIDFLELMRLIRPPFIMFSSAKSEFNRYIDFLIKHKEKNYQHFVDAVEQKINVRVNHNVNYQDNIVYKF